MTITLPGSFEALSSANKNFANALKGLAGTSQGSEFLDSVMKKVSQLPGMPKSEAFQALNKTLVAQGIPDRMPMTQPAVQKATANEPAAPENKPPKGLSM
jgi:hypothetical protein